MLEFDVETRGLQWYYPSQEMFLAQFFSPDAEECWPEACVACGGDSIDHEGVCEDPGCEAHNPLQAVMLRHPEDREQIQSWLDRAEELGGVRAWNSKFDLHMAEEAGYRLPPRSCWHDGMVLRRVLDERRSMGLQAAGDEIFGKDPWPEGAGGELEERLKAWLTAENEKRRKIVKKTRERLVLANYSDVPWEIMGPYAAHDVELQARICDVLEPKLADPEADKLPEVYQMEREILPALYDVEKRGMPIDGALVRPMLDQIEQQLAERSDRVIEIAGKTGDLDFNPNSKPQLVKVFEELEVDLSFCKLTKKKQKSLDSESLEAIDHELARAEEDRRAAETMKKMLYPLLHSTVKKGIPYEPFLAPDGRVHADQNQVGARTGRISTSPNVQNWPRDDLRMRHLVKAEEGNILVACDLDQIELRLLAAFLGDGKVKTMLLDPDSDIHTYTAKMVGLGPRDRGGGVVESPRQRGKKFNYERIYGGGVKAIRRWHGVSQSEAKDMLMRFYDAFPEVQEFQNTIEFTLFDKGFVRTPWGRRHRPYNRRNVDREAYKFVNYLIQGAAGDLFKDSVIRVHNHGIPIVALTHDEILAEVPIADAEEVGKLIVHELTDHPRIAKKIPLGADCKIVERWSYAKDPQFDPGL
jgi:DNA polymerase I-like protein with 3'-5' exonuclease and polymerase domains